MTKHHDMAKLVSTSGNMGKLALSLRSTAAEYPRDKDADKLIKFFENMVIPKIPSAVLKFFLLQVAMEYNWQHPYRKISWRRMNRDLRREVFFRLLELGNGERLVRIKREHYG